MASPTYGWAAGALVQGDITGDFDAIFYVTNDGQTWTADNQIKNFYPMDVTIGGSFIVFIFPCQTCSLTLYLQILPMLMLLVLPLLVLVVSPVFLHKILNKWNYN